MLILYLPGFPVVSSFTLGFCVADWPLLETEVVEYPSSSLLLDSTIIENSNIVEESLIVLHSKYMLYLKESSITCLSLIPDSNVCNCFYHYFGVIHFIVKFRHKIVFIYCNINSLHRRVILGDDL